MGRETIDTILRGITDRIHGHLTGDWTTSPLNKRTTRRRAGLYEVVVATDGIQTIADTWQNAALNFALRNIADSLSWRRDLRPELEERESLGCGLYLNEAA